MAGGIILNSNTKENKHYLTVGQFSNLTGISVSRLKFYDREGIFSPAMRGTGRENNYRYYSPMQIITVKIIRVLAENGVPLETIKDLTTKRTPDKLIKLLKRKMITVKNDISFLTEAYSVMEVYHSLIIEGIQAEEGEIYVCEMSGLPIILGDTNESVREDDFMEGFLNFCTNPRRPALNLSYPIGGYFSSMNTFLNCPSKPSRFFSLDPKGHERKEAGLYLVGYTRGYYGQVNDLPQKMEIYAKENGIVFDGPIYNIYLLDELSIVDPNDYLLQVSAAISETSRRLSPQARKRLQNSQ